MKPRGLEEASSRVKTASVAPCISWTDLPRCKTPGRDEFVLGPEELMADIEVAAPIERRTVLVRAAEERGLLGSKDRHIGGRFSDALVREAKRVRLALSDSLEFAAVHP